LILRLLPVCAHPSVQANSHTHIVRTGSKF
jgi:hypothetical protein